VQEAEQEVFRSDVVVVEESRLFLRQHHDPSSAIGEPFEHNCSLAPGRRG
jgi:hypothetical protein